MVGPDAAVAAREEQTRMRRIVTRPNKRQDAASRPVLPLFRYPECRCVGFSEYADLPKRSMCRAIRRPESPTASGRDNSPFFRNDLRRILPAPRRSSQRSIATTVLDGRGAPRDDGHRSCRTRTDDERRAVLEHAGAPERRPDGESPSAVPSLGLGARGSERCRSPCRCPSTVTAKQAYVPASR